MSTELNHTIVWSSDREAAAGFLAGILGLRVGSPQGPFLPVQLGNNVTLDYADAGGEVRGQHYAFLVSEGEFDAAFGRIQAAGIEYWADPRHQQPGTINHRQGGRGVYFDDPSGHQLELLTRT